MNPSQIYFDYMATTPIDPVVVEAMLRYMGPEGEFGNPASVTHVYGQTAAVAVEKARSQVAAAIGAEAQEIVFTSGATEAINLAILGAARFYQRKGRHIITMSTEHQAVLDTCRHLSREGFEITYLKPQTDGLLARSSLESALRDDTILVSIMHVNNEIGVIQDIQGIGQLLRGKGILFHVDAAQSVGRIGINLGELPVDLMSLSAHKNYGPKGIGALFVRQKPRIRLYAQSFGGGQEAGMRAGTLPTHQIVGMGEAFRVSESIREEEQARQLQLRQRLWSGISLIPGIQLNGSLTHRIAGNLNISVSGIDGSALIPALSGLAVSSTSACSAAHHQPSYVLQELGLNPALARSSIRLSIGRYTTIEQIDKAIDILNRQIAMLKSSN